MYPQAPWCTDRRNRSAACCSQPGYTLRSLPCSLQTLHSSVMSADVARPQANARQTRCDIMQSMRSNPNTAEGGGDRWAGRGLYGLPLNSVWGGRPQVCVMGPTSHMHNDAGSTETVDAEGCSAHASRHWENFYKHNADKFFKDRHYLDQEFPELASNPCNVLEVRCSPSLSRRTACGRS